MKRRTSRLNTLHSLLRDGLVTRLGGILRGVDGRLADGRRCAEEAGLSEEGLAEHVEGELDVRGVG